MKRNFMSDKYDPDTTLFFTTNAGEIVTPEYARQRIMNGYTRIDRAMFTLEERQLIAEIISTNRGYRGQTVGSLVRASQDYYRIVLILADAREETE